MVLVFACGVAVGCGFGLVCIYSESLQKRLRCLEAIELYETKERTDLRVNRLPNLFNRWIDEAGIKQRKPEEISDTSSFIDFNEGSRLPSKRKPRHEGKVHLPPQRKFISSHNHGQIQYQMTEPPSPTGRRASALYLPLKA